MTAGLLNDAAAATLDWLAPLLDEARRFYPVPGGVVSVTGPDGPVAAVTFGEDVAGVPMTTDRAFAIGSISKFFTALVVDAVVQEGQLHFDDPIGSLLTWADLPGELAGIPLAALLNHTGGLPLGGDVLPDDAGEIAVARGVGRAGASRRFHYSNLGYLMLGEAVLTATGRPLADHVAARILAPLGLRGARSQASHADRETMATGHWSARPDRPWVPGDALETAPWFELNSASGNVTATAGDMDRFAAAVLSVHAGLPVPTGCALTPASLARAVSDLAPGGEPVYAVSGIVPASSSHYGRGINVEEVGGSTCLTHGGGMVGYSTFWLVDIERGFAVTVLTNANGNCLAAHLLARATHAAIVGQLSDYMPTISLDTRVRGVMAGEGRFIGQSGVLCLHSGADGAEVEFAGTRATLFCPPEGRPVSDHPQLRTFPLDYHLDEDAWTCGPRTWRRDGGAVDDGPPHPLEGHYRSYSPWYRELRIYRRSRRLYLAAGDDVEAPADELALVETDEGRWRIGDDSWLPERLVTGPLRHGSVAVITRDACPYSRVFSP